MKAQHGQLESQKYLSTVKLWDFKLLFGSKIFRTVPDAPIAWTSDILYIYNANLKCHHKNPPICTCHKYSIQSTIKNPINQYHIYIYIIYMHPSLTCLNLSISNTWKLVDYRIFPGPPPPPPKKTSLTIAPYQTNPSISRRLVSSRLCNEVSQVTSAQICVAFSAEWGHEVQQESGMDSILSSHISCM